MEYKELELDDLEYEQLIEVANFYGIEIPEDSEYENVIEILKNNNINTDDLEGFNFKLYLPPDELLLFENKIENMEFGKVIEKYNNYLLGKKISRRTGLVRELKTKGIYELINYECDNKYPLSVQYLTVSIYQNVLLIKLLKDLGKCSEKKIDLKVDMINNIVTFRRPIKNYIIICKNYDYVYVPVFLRIKDENGIDTHSTALIFNTKDKTFEYFEPNGPDAEWNNLVENFLISDINKYLPEYTFSPILQFCPRGIQRGPLCTAYTSLYVWLRFKNVDISQKKILNELLLNGKTGVVYLVSQFICMMFDYIKINRLQNIEDRYIKTYNLISGNESLIDILNESYFNLDLNSLRYIYDSIIEVSELEEIDENEYPSEELQNELLLEELQNEELENKLLLEELQNELF